LRFTTSSSAPRSGFSVDSVSACGLLRGFTKPYVPGYRCEALGNCRSWRQIVGGMHLFRVYVITVTVLPPKAVSRPYKAPTRFSSMAISIVLTVDGFSISQSLTSLFHDHGRRAQARTAFSLIATPTIGTSEQTSPALFEQQTASKVNLDSKEDGSESSTPHGPSDLEKAETVDDERNGTSTGPYRAITSGRISRIRVCN